MYGTVARMRVKPGMESRMRELSNTWWTERAPNVKGAVSETVFRTDADANEFLLVAVFASKEDYEANANDPAQNEWFEQLASCLDGEPMWMDGEVVEQHFVSR